MQLENPLVMLRTLKGAPLSCLFALSIANQAVSAGWISNVTGYSPNTITRALDLLETYQLASCDSHRSAWLLTNGAIQLPLTAIPDDTAVDNPNRKNCDSPININIEDIKDSSENTILIETDSQKLRFETPTIEALISKGISRNYHTEPLFVSEISPEDVQRTETRLINRYGKANYNTGLLITALLSEIQKAPPRTNDNYSDWEEHE